MLFSPFHFTVTMHIKLEIGPCTVWPYFKFFETADIWEITLQEIKFFISCKYFCILTFYDIVRAIITIEFHSWILENRRQILEIKYLSNLVTEEIRR